MLRDLASRKRRNHRPTTLALAGARKIALHRRETTQRICPGIFGPLPLAQRSHFAGVATSGVARPGFVRTGQKGAHHERDGREQRRREQADGWPRWKQRSTRWNEILPG